MLLAAILGISEAFAQQLPEQEAQEASPPEEVEGVSPTPPEQEVQEASPGMGNLRDITTAADVVVLIKRPDMTRLPIVVGTLKGPSGLTEINCNCGRLKDPNMEGILFLKGPDSTGRYHPAHPQFSDLRPDPWGRLTHVSNLDFSRKYFRIMTNGDLVFLPEVSDDAVQQVVMARIQGQPPPSTTEPPASETLPAPQPYEEARSVILGLVSEVVQAEAVPADQE